MANSNVRAAADTLNAAIKALDVGALESAEFTHGEHTSYAFGMRFNLISAVRRLQSLSEEAVTEFQKMSERE